MSKNSYNNLWRLGLGIGFVPTLVFIAQPARADTIQVTAASLNPTDKGIEVVLETADDRVPQVFTSAYGKTFVANIINTQLRLPSGQEFRQENPSRDIASVVVTSLGANSVRVRVTGVADAPKVQLNRSDRGLIFSLTPATTPTATQPTLATLQQPTPTAPPKPQTATAQPPASNTDESLEILVTGERESYRVPSSTTGTKLEVPQRDIPQSIQVIPRQVIEDRQVVRLNELTDNVSGVQRVPGYGGLSSVGVRIRGFTTQFETLRNGFRDFGYLSPRDLANVERVEVLKGPASVLYGGGVTGFSGQINTITKKPLEEPLYQINMTAGSYDFYRPTLDFTGSLTGDRSLLYRLNLAYENADSFRDFNGNESYLIAPALTWKIGDRTNLTVELEQQHQNYFFDNGFPAEPEFLDLPRDRFVLGEPDLNDAEWDSTSITYNLEHEFSDNWKFRQGFNATTVNGSTASSFFDPLEADRRTLPRIFSESEESQENYSLQNEFFGKFNTGSVRHNFLFGVELARYRFDFTFFDGEIDPIDILDPVYGARPRNFAPGDRTAYGADNLGIYLQDLVELTPNFKILAGGRFDLNDAYRDEFDAAEQDQDETNSDFSPRLGIVYQPSQNTSLYASYSQSFAQLLPRSQINEQFKPTTGEQFEIGVKQDFNDRLSATLALYQLTRQNVLTTDPTDPNFQIQTGEQRSRGVELDLAGELLPGWNLIATYAYTDAVVTEDNDIPEGDRLDGTPKHSASLWTTYQIQDGSLQGLGFGLGLTFQGDREAQIPNSITLPSYVRTDAAIFYRQNNYKIALNIKNLFNTKYYESIENFSIFPGAPTTVLGTVSVEF
ncbi:MAG: Vitamin B12 transporter BtuB [Chroococcidiopsis sp. SAG 2025]|uniref:TonB-dependent siderophore receptor n=1 Tax=Chroococcidiopsis sp. SAG 2025 TaxID=171389 RepID=UPI0029374353|nr:TonB-dependent siderophore receptor [Chroococcidiopsis sp. SAG 2025]MDV2994837.1 Vitamin B12 transporter BtuB [Chroococcidiopsis sp. SAG 2025]